MKFKAPTLTPGKRATLERTKEWLASLVKELAAKKTQLYKLTSTFDEASSRKHRFELEAARDHDAALNLAGAEAQLSRLQPEIDGLKKALSRETATAVRQSNLVRSTELRELLFGPLIEQLRASVASAISPFFDDDWARGIATQISERTNQWRQISFYVNRPPVVTEEFDEATREIRVVVKQLEQILAGETLIEA